MQSVNEETSQFLDFEFKLLPGYAKFLYEKCFEEFVRYIVSESYELNVPILKYLQGYTREQVTTLSMDGNRKLLTAIFEDDVADYLQETQRTWVENQLPVITRDKVLAEDITLISYIRRKAFRCFLPQFSNDGAHWLMVMQEVDQLTVILDSALLNTLIQVQQNEISSTNSALQHREQQLLEAQAIGNIGSFEWDLTGGKSVYSPQVYSIFGMTGERSRGLESFISFVHPDDRELFRQALERSLQTGEFQCEYRYEKDKDNPRYILSKGKVSFNEDRKPVRMVGTLMDITEKQVIIRKLEESEERNKQAQALTHIGNWSYDPQTGHVEGSDELFRIFGLEPQSENLTLQSLLSFFADPKEQRLLRSLSELPQKAAVPDRSWQIIRRDGTRRIIKGKGEVIKTSNGNNWSVIGTVQDITQEFELTEKLREREHYLKELNRSLALKNEQLLLKNKELESFNFIASHDLQEPLRKIQIFSNRILTDAREPLTGDTLAYFARITEAAARMQKLIDDFLVFSQTINAPRVFESADLTAIIEEAKAEMLTRITEKHATIKTGALPQLRVIPFQIKQLFVNLISNSLKYSQEKTPPMISITAETHTLERWGVSNNVVTIRFSDNGIGFDQKYADKVFELFQRLHNKNEFSGTGIGLALCKKICENHGGSIAVTSIPDQGTTFTIQLPCS